MKAKCPVCEQADGVEDFATQRQTAIYVCPKCKKFEITDEAEVALKENPNFIEKKYILLGILRNRKASDKPILITTKNFKELIDMAPIPKEPFEAIDKILLYIYENTSSHSSYVGIKTTDFPIVYAKGPEDLKFYLKNAIDLGYIELEMTTQTQFRLMLFGWKRIGELRIRKKVFSQAFVAMSFSKELESAWKNGFSPAIESTGYTPTRVDKQEHNLKIDDYIISEIRKSGLLIADFTENRPGVYFEAGFAMGLGIPVIWCAREDHVEKIHFDTRQYNHIFWKNPEDLKVKLTLRIEATVPFNIDRFETK